MKKMWFMKPPSHAVGGPKLLRVMKLIIILLVACGLNLSATAKAQKLDLNIRKGSLLDALSAIEKQSNYRFAYSADFIEMNREVNLNVQNQDVIEVLDQLLEGTNYLYRLQGDFVIFLPKESNQVSKFVQDQVITIKGIVADVNGEPLPGVNVFEKGNSINGVITGIDGNYNINVSSAECTLIFSYIGFQSQEVIISGRTNVNITLVEEATDLDEVIVVGFGTQKKSNVTGATTTVDMENVLGNRPVTNTMQAIQGTVPGMQITVPSGEPGATTSINIRGTTSINGGSALILMDNVPVSAEDVNPQDVESITVLKDAAASSIYGARAAFGVILITTKKGGKDQPIKFNYSNTFSFGTATDIAEKESTYNFVNAMNDWGVTSYWTNQDIPTWVNFLEEYKNDESLYPEGYATDEYGVRYPLTNTKTIDELIGQGSFSQIHNFNFSGGGKKSQYRVSLGYSDEDGIMISKNDRYTRYNFATVF
jgi:TonB-linked SusC/RagA family outer membrane protein